MIQSPVSVSFVASGDVLVAECDRRIQLFDRNGRSVRVIGWGNIKPQAVCVGPDGFIAIAEKTSQTIRFYFDDGRDAGLTRRWPDRMFGMPCSVAVGATTGQVIVADSDRRSVTIHSPGGAVMTRIASEHLGNPTHVAVAGDGTIYVSDSLHSCIKVG
jgi:DNA-binding beta-propeller fold protein YncE